MIDDIHNAIHEEMAKRKIKSYCSRMDFQKMLRWSHAISERENLNHENFERYVKEIFWGLSSLDLNIGYTLISLKNTSYPSGKSGSISNPKKIDRAFTLSDIHYWYHISNFWESVYRIWERIISLLKTRLVPNLREKLYFDGFSNFISNERIGNIIYRVFSAFF